MRMILVAVLIVLAGCAGSELTALPRHSGDIDWTTGQAGALKVGDQARIGLKNGETVRGEVTAVSAESVTVVRVGNYGLEENTVYAADVLTAERATVGKTWVVIVGCAVGLIAVLAHSFLSYDWN